MAASAVARPRPPVRRVDGVLLLDKPPGMSSNAALQRAKRFYAADKAGHTGTLDPLASGLLPVCFGEATKYAQALLDARKEYLAEVRFGVATTTGDAEGSIVATGPVGFTRAELAAALPRFTGRIRQIPPRHAALKHEGRPWYDYARAGIEIPRAPRDVDVGAVDLLDWTPPVAALRIECGKGTYIRALAEDLGAALGTCAHVAALRRTASGPFLVADGVTLDALAADAAAARDARLRPVETLVVALPRLDLDAECARSLGHGRTVEANALPPGRYRCHAPSGFVGVVEIADGLIRAGRMMRAG
jgi:tRNA pseudouridine55 synthase